MDTVAFHINASDGTAFPFSSPSLGKYIHTSPFQSEYIYSEGAQKLQATVPGWFYQKIKNEPLRIQGRAYVTLFALPTTTTILPSQKQVSVPGGLCSADSSEDGRTYFVLCTSALRGDRELRTVRVQVAVGARTEYLVPYEQYQAVSYSLLPADFGLDPVVRRQYMVGPYNVWEERSPAEASLKAAEVITSKPIAHLWTDFEITGPRLTACSSIVETIDHEVNMLHGEGATAQ